MTAARIDTTATTEVEVGGESFTVRTMTGRDSVKANSFAADAYEILSVFGEDEQVTGQAFRDVHDLQFEILRLGLVDIDPDTILPGLWPQLSVEILAVNALSEDDAGNSQSA